jgi:hypothetical protein
MRTNNSTATIIVIFSFIVGMLSLYDRLRTEEDSTQLITSKTCFLNQTTSAVAP